MKQLPLVLCTLLLLVTGAHAQTPVRSESPSWKLYTIEDEDFAVALPLLPAMHIQYEYLENTRKYRKLYFIGSYADGVVYVIHVAENPKPRRSLESFIRQRTAYQSAQVLDRDVTLDGFSGKSNKEGTRRFFATEDRLYDFWASGAPSDDARMTNFFSSLSLRKKENSIEVKDGPGLPYEPPVEAEPSSDETTKKIHLGKEVTSKARLGMKPEPSYTEVARRNQITGTVVLKCIFSANGSVTNIRIVSGLPHGLTEKAIDAARKIKFIPAMKDGKYVSMWMQLEYNFNLY